MNIDVIRARSARAFELAVGDSLEVATSAGGKQVVDTWALDADDPRHHLSMAHSRMGLGRVFVREGDVLVATDRKPMLRLASDTSPGVHDTLVPACDAERYRRLGAVGYHANCADNFRAALRHIGHETTAAHFVVAVPAPLNLFMNVPVDAGGAFDIEAPVSSPGDTVILEALRPLILVLSACPQDLASTNGAAQQPEDVGVRLHRRQDEGA